MSTFESRQAAWDYYLNLDSHHFEEKQHNNIYTDAFEAGAEWANEHPDTEDLEVIMAYTFRGLGWLAENIEADMGTTRERALGCIDTLQFLCNDVIMELRNKKNSCKYMKLWIARDKNNGLYLYTRLPSLGCYGTLFDADHDEYLMLDEDSFPEVTFENSPQQIEIKLVKEE